MTHIGILDMKTFRDLTTCCLVMQPITKTENPNQSAYNSEMQTRKFYLLLNISQRHSFCHSLCILPKLLDRFIKMFTR